MADYISCDLTPSRVAAWWSEDLCLKISGAAAAVLAEEGKLDLKKLEPHRESAGTARLSVHYLHIHIGPKEYDTRKHVSDPLTGGGAAIFSTITNYYAGIAQIFYNPVSHRDVVSWSRH
jgi:sterol 3beta-glucosyltransferase